MNIRSTNTTLSENYHVKNFVSLIKTVAERYPDLLNHSEKSLRHSFTQLRTESQSLYVRLLTRKGPYIRKDKLDYNDIEDLETCLDELNSKGMVELNAQRNPTDLLNKLTKAELITLFPISKSSHCKKHALIDLIERRWGHESVLNQLLKVYTFITPTYQDEFQTYLLCFFGNTYQDLSEFVITDLGHVHYEKYDLCLDTRFYNQRSDIETHKQYALMREQIRLPEIVGNSSALINLAAQIPKPDNHPGLQRRYEKMLLHIARQLERLNQYNSALALYQMVEIHPARERQARILKKQDQLQAALSVCLDMKRNGSHPEELEFAQRFGASLAKSLNQTFPKDNNTSIHRQEMTLEKGLKPVETLLAEYLSPPNQQHSQTCHYVENALFCALFGLYFWDIIFMPIKGAFLNPFQRGPMQLQSEYFYQDRKQPIDLRLQEMTHHNWQQRILDRYSEKEGVANPFVHWKHIDLPLLQKALQHIPTQHMQGVFQRISLHPGLYRNGFPDLICFSRSGYELIEVKAPGDVIQPNQKRWFKQFAQLGIPASVVKVTWLQND